MKLDELRIRSATEEDGERAQELRKLAWQARYANSGTGVTRELLVNSLAKLPPSRKDVEHYKNILSKKANKDKNLVAVLGDEIIGVIFYDVLDTGVGDIGVFVDNKFNGKGVGGKLLEKLIAITDTPLQVIIFAKNPSREFYKHHGFIEVGVEEKHYFSKDIYLPVQTLKLDR